MSIFPDQRPSVNSVHPLHDRDLDGPIQFDQGPFPNTYLYGVDEGAIPLDPDVYQALFDPTDSDRADHKQLLESDPSPDWNDLDGPSSEDAPSGPVDAIQEIVDALESAETEFGQFLASHLKELLAEGRILGFPSTIEQWFDRRAAMESR